MNEEFWAFLCLDVLEQGMELLLIALTIDVMDNIHRNSEKQKGVSINTYPHPIVHRNSIYRPGPKNSCLMRVARFLSVVSDRFRAVPVSNQCEAHGRPIPTPAPLELNLEQAREQPQHHAR